MKKLFVLLLLSIPLFGQTFEHAYTQNDGMSFTDSLYMTNADSSIAGDTVKIYDLNYLYEFIEITITDTGASIVDTIGLYYGKIRYDEAKTPLDTIWTPLRVKDSTWTTIQTPLIAGGAVKSYTTYHPIIKLLKIQMLNTPWRAGQRTRFTVEGIRRQK